MGKYKVIPDTSVLISASLNHIIDEIGGKRICDHFHPESKSLFDHFENKERCGLITKDIENSASKQMIKAFSRNLAKKIGSRPEEIQQNLSNYSYSLVKVIGSLCKNIALLDKIEVDESKLLSYVQRVKKFYHKLINDVERIDIRKVIKDDARSAPRGLRGLCAKLSKEYQSTNFRIHPKLIRKLKTNPPDNNDIRILAHALCLSKESIYPETEIVIAANDHHFSKVNIDGSLSTFVPDKIRERLHIRCGWPAEILELLKKDDKIEMMLSGSGIHNSQ